MRHSHVFLSTVKHTFFLCGQNNCPITISSVRNLTSHLSKEYIETDGGNVEGTERFNRETFCHVPGRIPVFRDANISAAAAEVKEESMNVSQVITLLSSFFTSYSKPN